jgi:hypothetical protein
MDFEHKSQKSSRTYTRKRAGGIFVIFGGQTMGNSKNQRLICEQEVRKKERRNPLKMPALNERFGATAAGSADLKGRA